VIPVSEAEYNRLKAEVGAEAFDNIYMPRMYLQITSRCNMRCRHCFSAVDERPLTAELTLYEIRELLRQARAAGMCSVSLTGGEPTLHPALPEILRCIKENELTLLDFNTNGYELKEEIPDLFRELGFDPNIKISLDGIGTHDDFRMVAGSENKALEAMSLCAGKGFRTYAQTQVNRMTESGLPLLLDRVESLGLTSVRLIKTTSTPRWALCGKDYNFTFEEYNARMYSLACRQIEKKHKTALDIWQIGYLDPEQHRFNFSCEKVKRPDMGDSLCPAYGKMISVGANGKVYPCLEMQGVVDSFGYDFGNIREKSLRDILNEGAYHNILQYTVTDRQKLHEECLTCGWKELCQGGCPGMAMIDSQGDYLGIDKSCCAFFKNGFYEKFKSLSE